MGGLERPAQGQHRLRLARSLHRQRGNAGHHHRGDHETLPAPAGSHDGAGGLRHARRGAGAAGSGATARGVRPDRVRTDGRCRAESGAQAFPATAPGAAALPLDGVAGDFGFGIRRPRASLVRAIARERAGKQPDPGRCGGIEPGAVARAVAAARVDSARPGRGRPQHQTRHRAADIEHSGLCGTDRCGAAGGVSRRFLNRNTVLNFN